PVYCRERSHRRGVFPHVQYAPQCQQADRCYQRRPPKAIHSLQDRLRSRFEWGLLADVQPPEYEHRLAILRSKAELMRFAIPASVIEYIARPECSSVRELEGSLNRVIAYATLHDQ